MTELLTALPYAGFGRGYLFEVVSRTPIRMGAEPGKNRLAVIPKQCTQRGRVIPFGDTNLQYIIERSMLGEYFAPNWANYKRKGMPVPDDVWILSPYGKPINKEKYGVGVTDVTNNNRKALYGKSLLIALRQGDPLPDHPLDKFFIEAVEDPRTWERMQQEVTWLAQTAAKRALRLPTDGETFEVLIDEQGNKEHILLDLTNAREEGNLSKKNMSAKNMTNVENYQRNLPALAQILHAKMAFSGVSYNGSMGRSG